MSRTLYGLIAAATLWSVPGTLYADAYRDLLRAAKKGDEAEILSALDGVDSDPSTRLVQLLVHLGVQTPSEPVYARVRQRLAGIQTRSGLKALERTLSRARDVRARKLALFALGDIDVPETVGMVKAGLSAKDPEVRIAVARALGQKAYRESVDELIDVLGRADKVGGEFSATVRRSLHALTLQDLPTEDDWKKWWQFERDRWKPPGQQALGRTRVGSIKPPGDFPKFFGVEIFSLRVVFVIDVSGSMKEPVRGHPMQRVELVKKELVQAIEKLGPKARFTVITFSDKIVPHTPDLVPATPANKEKAIRFVRSLAPSGTTWTQEALEAAFGMESANTIVLLTDGMPCKGGPILPTEPILAAVRQWNRFRKATIHTIGFAQAHYHFLRALARENGGEYHSAQPPVAPLFR